MSRAEIHSREARLAAEYLNTIGQPKHANAVRNVIVSLSRARATLSQLHGDNMKLRQAKEVPACPN